MRSAATLILIACSLPAGCATSEEAPDPWSKDFGAPRVLVTERMRLEPLAPEHVELDFAALMESRGHLRRTLRWGDWPREDFTVAENRKDLERHGKEFEGREAYAYTVLTPDRSRCIGCIYLNPVDGRRTHPRRAVLAFWVTEDRLATHLDRHLVDELITWFESAWPLDRVDFLAHATDARKIDVLRAAATAERDATRPRHRAFAWIRGE